MLTKYSHKISFLSKEIIMYKYIQNPLRLNFSLVIHCVEFFARILSRTVPHTLS